MVVVLVFMNGYDVFHEDQGNAEMFVISVLDCDKNVVETHEKDHRSLLQTLIYVVSLYYVVSLVLVEMCLYFMSLCKCS